MIVCKRNLLGLDVITKMLVNRLFSAGKMINVRLLFQRRPILVPNRRHRSLKSAIAGENVSDANKRERQKETDLCSLSVLIKEKELSGEKIVEVGLSRFEYGCQWSLE